MAAGDPIVCLICGNAAQDTGSVPGFVTRVDCPRCGRYRITASLEQYWQFLRNHPKHEDAEAFRTLAPYLAAHIRQSGEEVGLGDVDWKELAERHRLTSVPEKARRLLDVLASRSSAGGQWIVYDSNELAPLLDAGDGREVDYLLAHMRQKGLLEIDSIGKPNSGRDAMGGGPAVLAARLTVEGWTAVAPLGGAGIPGTCFVAMAFAQSLEDAYDQGIKPAINACGLREIRVDKLEHNGIVTDVIMAEIRRAQVTVADVTLQRQGVYFEAGFALGLGRTVVWSCRSDEIGKVHFDTRQYSHIVWNDAADLRTKMEARLRATVPLPVKP